MAMDIHCNTHVTSCAVVTDTDRRTTDDDDDAPESFSLIDKHCNGKCLNGICCSICFCCLFLDGRSGDTFTNSVSHNDEHWVKIDFLNGTKKSATKKFLSLKIAVFRKFGCLPIACVLRTDISFLHSLNVCSICDTLAPIQWASRFFSPSLHTDIRLILTTRRPNETHYILVITSLHCKLFKSNWLPKTHSIWFAQCPAHTEKVWT